MKIHFKQTKNLEYLYGSSDIYNKIVFNINA